MKDDRTVKFKCQFQLGLENLTHLRRNVAVFEAIKPDLADAQEGRRT